MDPRHRTLTAGRRSDNRRRRRSIAFRLSVSFLVILLAMVALSAFALYGFAQQRTAMHFASSHHLQEISLFDDIRLQIVDAVHQDRDYAQTGDAVYDDAFKADVDEIKRLFVVHAAMHKDSPLTLAEQQGTARLRRVVEEFAAVQEQVDELFTADRQRDARQLAETRGKQAAARAVRVIQDLVALERREAATQAAAAAAATDRSYRLVVVTALIAVAMAGGIAVSVARSVTTPVQRLVETMRRVDRGTLNVRAGVQGGDEIGELARHFDHMVARLEATFGEQERFLADISHELRTPITIIRGHLEILGRGSRTPEQIARALSVTLDELGRMGRLVDDFVLLARAGRPDFLVPQRIAFRDFLATLFQKASAIAPRDWRLGPLAEVVVAADPDRLTEAVLNLLRNAANHTREGQRIELSSRAATGVIEIAVADDGEGISSADLAHIFERFYRGPSARAVPGSGLGLSIVHAVATAHGGTVEARSAIGAGSTFVIRLPMRAVDVEPAAGPARSDRQWHTASSSSG